MSVAQPSFLCGDGWAGVAGAPTWLAAMQHTDGRGDTGNASIELCVRCQDSAVEYVGGGFGVNGSGLGSVA